tara:strand:+ start:2317 stop:5304 length:2988 start_codon:yes stop_codon:yes gene_type:complete
MQNYILEKLGYLDSPNLIRKSSENFKSYKKHIVSQAFNEMDVDCIFGIWSHSHYSSEKSPSKIFTPIVYVAKADSDAHAQEIHKRVWSQGAVPFLLTLIGDDTLVYCDSFKFDSKNWYENTKFIKTKNSNLYEIQHLYARNLKSSHTWRNLSINSHSRVDNKLLDNLENLHDALITNKFDVSPLNSKVINSVIGKYLYLFMLIDRGIISNNWIKIHSGIVNFDSVEAKFTTIQFKTLFEKLSIVFNGSIFPISNEDFLEITDKHLIFIKGVLRHDHKISNSGVQLSFIDFHFGSIQTETLSSIYEKFLETESPIQKRGDGAYYTPPFLVDYIVSNVEHIQKLSDGIKILDPSMGSGVFLVSAYRRIVEQYLIDNNHLKLNGHILRSLLINNIFGVEKNRSACNVASFSLYITMLDYIDEDCLEKLTANDAPQIPLFPELIGHNFICDDFFNSSDELNKVALEGKFDVVLGNPPWQKIDEVSPVKGKDYLLENRELLDLIDQNEAAELFTQKVVREHLKIQGALAFLLPTKSFISPSAKKFATGIFSSIKVEGIANFSHLRYKLFKNARQPALALYLKNESVDNSHKVTLFSPHGNQLPFNKSGEPWMIIEDSAQIKKVSQKEIANDTKGILQLLTLSQTDKRIKQYLMDGVESGKFLTLNHLLSKSKFSMTRGDGTFKSGISKEFILGADKTKPNYFRKVLKLDNDFLTNENIADYNLMEYELKNSPKRKLFSGNILVVPRSMNDITFVEQPFAFNSSINAIYYDCDKGIGKKERELLLALGKYLNSKFVKYFFALFGSLWVIDKTRIEAKDLKRFPVPIFGVKDPNVECICNLDDDSLEEWLFDYFGFDPISKQIIKEYQEFRSMFEDGQVPNSAYDEPDAFTQSLYKRTLHQSLHKFISEPGRFQVQLKFDEQINIGVVDFCYFENEAELSISNESLISSYVSSGESCFSDSSFISFNQESFNGTLFKPMEKAFWTVERAISDSQKILDKILS